LVLKRECEITLWCHKQHIYSNNDHHMPLLNTKIS